MKNYKYFGALGSIMLIFAGINLSVSSILLLLKVPIMGVTVFISLLLTLIVSWNFFAKEGSHKIKTVLSLISTFIIIFGIFIVVSIYFFDLSWDGQAYHQEAIIRLTEGWNPIYDAPLSNDFISNFWINHYAKGSWINSATIYSLIGNIEAGKVFNFIYIIASFLLSYRYLFPKLKNMKLSILLSLIIAFNPVSINQLFSYYADGQLASLITCLLVAVLLSWQNFNRVNLALIFSCIVLIVNIKFTGLVYAVILSSIIFLPFLKVTKKNIGFFWINDKIKFKKGLVLLIVSFIFAVGVSGYNPYITNFIEKGHPFYPLSGKESVDIISYNIPKNLGEKNRIEQFLTSIFSYTSNDRSKEPIIKIPFSVVPSELVAGESVDIRVGGFGPLFGAAVIVVYSLILINIRELLSKRYIISHVFLIAILFSSVIINPEPWWARYIPQMWLIPIYILSLLFYIQKSKNRWLGILNMFGISILAVNIILTSYPYLTSQHEKNMALKTQLNVLSSYSQKKEISVYFDRFRSNRIRLSEYNINFSEIKEVNDCTYKAKLTRSTTYICTDDNLLYKALTFK